MTDHEEYIDAEKEMMQSAYGDRYVPGKTGTDHAFSIGMDIAQMRIKFSLPADYPNSPPSYQFDGNATHAEKEELGTALRSSLADVSCLTTMTICQAFDDVLSEWHQSQSNRVMGTANEKMGVSEAEEMTPKRMRHSNISRVLMYSHHIRR